MTWWQQLIRRWRERRPDPAWHPTGIRQVFSDYDDRKPIAAAQRAADADRQRRQQAQIRAGFRR
jgi:hypothetical protein